VKIAPFDAELNAAHNPNGVRNNPSSIANPDRKYLETLPRKTCIFSTSGTLLPMTPSEN
jgi:hypothetical protein